MIKLLYVKIYSFEIQQHSHVLLYVLCVLAVIGFMSAMGLAA